MAEFTLAGYETLVPNAVYTSLHQHGAEEREEREKRVVVVSRYTAPTVAQALGYIQERARKAWHVLLPIGRKRGEVLGDEVDSILLRDTRSFLEDLAEGKKEYKDVLQKYLPGDSLGSGYVAIEHLALAYGSIDAKLVERLTEKSSAKESRWYAEKMKRKNVFGVMLDKGGLIPPAHVHRLQKAAPANLQPIKYSVPVPSHDEVADLIVALYQANPSPETISRLSDASEEVLENIALLTLSKAQQELARKHAHLKSQAGTLFDSSLPSSSLLS